MKRTRKFERWLELFFNLPHGTDTGDEAAGDAEDAAEKHSADAEWLPAKVVEEQRGEQVGGHLGNRVDGDADVKVGLEVDHVEAQPVVHHRAEKVDEHGQH